MNNKNKKRPMSKITILFCILIIIFAIFIFLILANGNNVTINPIDKSSNMGNGSSLDESTIIAKDATIDSPTNFGEWIKVKLYGATFENNKIINNYNDAYVRINKMTRGVNELKPYIDKYNKSKVNDKIDFNSLNSSEEFVLLEYEVYLPLDFKCDEDITNINLKIKTVSSKGEDSIKVGDVVYSSNYATVTSESIKSNSILPGNVVKLQSIIGRT